MQTLDEREVQGKLRVMLTMIEQRGETFLICRNGKPIADLTPHIQDERPMPRRRDQKVFDADPVLQKLQQVIQAGLIIPHSKKLRQASMPTIEVQGTPLSQIIIEDRR